MERRVFEDSAAGLCEMFDRPRQAGFAAGRSRPGRRVPDRCVAATWRLVKSASRLLQAATAWLRSIQEEFQRPQSVGLLPALSWQPDARVPTPAAHSAFEPR